MVKSLPGMRETRVRSMGWEDSPGNRGCQPTTGVATHSSILAWEISWIEEPGGLQSMGSQRVRHDLATKQQTIEHLMPAGS